MLCEPSAETEQTEVANDEQYLAIKASAVQSCVNQALSYPHNFFFLSSHSNNKLQEKEEEKVKTKNMPLGYIIETTVPLILKSYLLVVLTSEQKRNR